MKLNHTSPSTWATAVLLLAIGVALPAQSQRVEDLLSRTGEYVIDSIRRLANVVAVEVYEQRLFDQSASTGRGPLTLLGTDSDRRLTSDVLLVRFPGAETDWMLFRDVTVVNGTPVRQSLRRLLALFEEPGERAAAEAQAAAIAVESAGYHMPGGSFAVTNPLVAVALMHPSYQPRLRFTLGGEDRSMGNGIRVVRFQELEQSSGGKLAPLFGPVGRARGSVWIEENSGRILKTDTQFAGSTFSASSTTTFAIDERLGMLVPVEMRTRWRATRTATVSGIATYGQFRRFAVRTETGTPILDDTDEDGAAGRRE